MTRTRVSACAVLVAASLAGCGSTRDVQYAGEVHVTSPELVQLGPGVQVIADADEPIFFTGGDYWLYRDGYWFRSNDYRSGYARIEYRAVPQELRDIDKPQLYVHYSRNARTRAARADSTRTRSRPTPLAPEHEQMPMEEQTQSSSPTSPSTTTPSPSPRTTPPDLRDNPQVPGEQPRGINPNDTTPPPGAVPPTTAPGEMRPVTPQDRADQATPPAKTNPDNRARDDQGAQPRSQSANPEDNQNANPEKNATPEKNANPADKNVDE